jgi:hypothetical protein
LRVLVVAVVIVVIVAAGVFLYVVQPVRPAAPSWERMDGGGNTCPDPSFLLNTNILSPSPVIGNLVANDTYSAGCYRFTASDTYSDGGSPGSAYVNVSVWPATGPGSWSSPPPANATLCGAPPPGAEGGGCVYIPPPAFFAQGLNGPDGSVDLTIGMPVSNYTVEVWEWVGGTESEYGLTVTES